MDTPQESSCTDPRFTFPVGPTGHPIPFSLVGSCIFRPFNSLSFTRKSTRKFLSLLNLFDSVPSLP